MLPCGLFTRLRVRPYPRSLRPPQSTPRGQHVDLSMKLASIDGKQQQQPPPHVDFTATASVTSEDETDRGSASPVLSMMSLDDPSVDVEDYSTQGALDIVKIRTKWLAVFCLGLGAAAVVMQHYEEILENNVQLAFYVPLLIGHGGNTGSQTVSSIIRALAMRQVRWRRAAPAILKEAIAGGIMGGLLGLPVLALSLAVDRLSTDVGMTVAIALPLVSLWANGIGTFITLASYKLRLDPAITSGPLVTTVVDCSGLVIYFAIAEVVLTSPPS